MSRYFTSSPAMIRQLFVTMAVHCDLADARALYDKFHERWIDQHSDVDDMLWQLKDSFQAAGVTLESLNLPFSSQERRLLSKAEQFDRIAAERMQRMLNSDQKHAFEIVMDICDPARPMDNKAMFLDGPGGSGKSFLYKTKYSTLYEVKAKPLL